MYPFGLLLILFCIYGVLKYRSKQELFMFFFTWELLLAGSRMNYGYFLRIGGSEIDYNDVLLGILFFLSIDLMITQKKFSKKIVTNGVTLLFVIFWGMMLCQMVPAKVEVIDFNHSWDLYLRGFGDQMQLVTFSSQSIMMCFRVILFVCILVVTDTVIVKEKWIEIAESVFNKFKFIIVYGVFEVFAKFALKIPMNDYLNAFFGRGISTGGGLDRLQGICREPSYYALALFNFIVLALVLGQIKKTNCFFWTITAIILGSLSSSFSFWICMVAIILIWIFLSGEKQQKLRFIIWGGVAVVCIGIAVIITSQKFLIFATGSSFTLLNRIAESVIQIRNGLGGTLAGGSNFSSEAARLGGGMLTLKAGMSRPLFGLGIGTAYCVTGLICIFANIGILGLLQWIKLLFVDYGHHMPLILILIVLMPVLLCNDLYTLYDTYYLLLIPVISIAVNLKGSDECENNTLCLN